MTFLKELIPNLISIFVFVLIISGNYLGELFPCKVQKIFSENIFVKHVLGFLTLIFFVSLTIPEIHEQEYMLVYSTLIYSWFILMAKCHYKIWFVVFAIIGVIYIVKMYKKTLKDKDTKMLDKGTDVLSLLSIFLTFFGFLSYMGAKKLEYKSKFKYLTFIFGRPSCRNSSPKFPGFLKLIKNAFN